MSENRTNAAAAAEAAPPMTMAAAVRPVVPQKNLLGFANVTFNGALTVTDFKVLQGEAGNVFVGMPSKAIGNGKYSPTAWIKDGDMKQRLTDTVTDAYYAAVEKLKARAAALDGKAPSRIAGQLDKAGKQAAAHNAALPEPAKAGRAKNAER
ncbi:MAG: SpoVG family protein [Oscillospiraceae bacterium]|jgi:DNA-binding cell septation regulator SpoVG|nr:SpoVG family protein [Oscillospiraceae bacterium]